MVSTLDSESKNPSSNLGRTFFFCYASAVFLYHGAEYKEVWKQRKDGAQVLLENEIKASAIPILTAITLV